MKRLAVFLTVIVLSAFICYHFITRCPVSIRARPCASRRFFSGGRVSTSAAEWLLVTWGAHPR